MSLEIRPVSSACGAEVTGIDLSQPLDRDAWSAIEQGFRNHIVLVFRDQDLDDAARFAFAEKFGPIANRSRPKDKFSEGEAFDRRGGSLISNIRKDGKPIGSLPDGEMWFHHDGCHSPAPYRATFLYAVEIPSTGGNTRFANMYKAYDKLPENIKKRIQNIEVLQIYNYGTVGRADLSQGLDAYRHHIHPVVISHPDTGRKALYVNPLMSARIEGIPQDESATLLATLLSYTEDDAIIYEHHWRPGDLLVWDNLASTHARTDFPAHETRLLRRCTVEGVPIHA